MSSLKKVVGPVAHGRWKVLHAGTKENFIYYDSVYALPRVTMSYHEFEPWTVIDDNSNSLLFSPW